METDQSKDARKNNLPIYPFRLQAILARSLGATDCSFGLKTARYSSGFARKDQTNPAQIRAPKMRIYFCASPKSKDMPPDAASLTLPCAIADDNETHEEDSSYNCSGADLIVTCMMHSGIIDDGSSTK